MGGAGGSRPTPTVRAKTISVEVRRKRTYVKRGEESTPVEAPVEAAAAAAPEAPVVVAAAPVAAPPPRRPEAQPSRPPRERQTLRSTPHDGGRRRSELEALRAEQEARRLGELEEQERRAREEQERRREAEDARRLAAADAEAQRLLDEAARPAGEPEPALAEGETPTPALVPDVAALVAEADEVSTRRRGEAAKSGQETRLVPRRAKRPAEVSEKEKAVKKAGRKDTQRSRGDQVVPQVEYEEVDGDTAGGRPRRRRKGAKPQLQDKHVFQRPTAPVIREVEIPETISVGELASRMSVKAGDVVKALFKQGHDGHHQPDPRP